MHTVRRLRGKRTRVYTTQDAGTANASPSKRAKRSTTTYEGSSYTQRDDGLEGRRIYRLDHLPQMPVDILYETFGHLTPEDLLPLVRSNKAFRRLLLNRSSSVVWRVARRNVEGMPDCPPYLSEPKYASLIFSGHCCNCGVNDESDTDVLWAFNVRYCKVCKNAMLVLRRSSDLDINEILVLPHTSGPTRKGVATYYFHLPDLLRYSEIMSSEESQDFKEAYTVSEAEVTLQIIETVPSLDKFTTAIKRRRQAQARAAKGKRIQAISERLKNAGFEEDWVCLLGQRDEWLKFSKHPLVGNTEPLTDVGWEGIQTEIQELMKAFRERRLLVQYKETLINRLTAFKLRAMDIPKKTYSVCTNGGWVAPHFIDIFLLPEVRSIVDVPSETKLDHHDHERLCNILPALAEAWLSTVVAQLRAHVESQFRAESTGDLFQLAIASFRCSRCNVALRYPEVLSHDCCWRSLDFYRPEVQVRQYAGYEQSAFIVIHEFLWSCTALQWCPWADKFGMLLQVCGLDPMSATLEQTKTLDTKVNCTICVARGRKKPMSCLEAVRPL
ncbi:hypothetical protein NEOLEDRAFT_1238049 [Neolentinus lepideus HHB14362 ss-1]|uniref:F-box domain-containing protein n=1 Tax=Neolentinus lepideus HHB14362 ss-1 TaxID=1314782 RepID=A0A165W9G5_9AGAM|nr:hypothetical protein NEOLEDRAFT_1238049 [Neolentinus lepideus HHB14362 ss-1]